MRVLYTIIQAYKYRKCLKKIIMSKNNQIDNICDLKISHIKKFNIKYLALDYDGVLSYHGENIMDDNISIWLNKFSKILPLYIISNNPTISRKELFKKKHPNIRFILNVKKKPYPSGIIKIQKINSCKFDEIGLVDDRLLTGCLACCIVGSYPILLMKPKIKTYYSVIEIFFILLRMLERKIFF